MRKYILMIFAAMLLCTCMATAVSETLFVDNRETDKVYPERLNLRDQPSQSGAIVGLYYTGAEVQNLGAENDAYTKVQIGGVMGYMASEYLITAEEAVRRYGEDSGFGSCRAAEVDLTGLWLDEIALLTSPDSGSQALGMLKSGTQTALIGIVDTWAYIAAELDGKRMYGYVPLDVLTDVGEMKVSIIAGSKADSKTILYDAPNNRANQIMSLKNGTACFTLFSRREGEWRRVRVGGESGWIKYTQTSSLFPLAGQERTVVPYYPLLMQTKKTVSLQRDMAGEDEGSALERGMKVEVLAECGDLAYVRTLEGGVGAYDCGDFGFVPISALSLASETASVGVAQVDDDDLPAAVLREPDAGAQLVGALLGGAQVRILDYTQTDYVKVALGEVTGYIPKDGIRILTAVNADVSDRIPQRAFMLKSLPLRQKPSASAKELGRAEIGERVYMLGVLGDWAFVQAADKHGLDMADDTLDCTGFVPLSALNAPASTTHLTAFVTADKVNLRDQDSGTDGRIIGKVRTGERLRLADYGMDWSLVVTPDGTRGYIMTEYLEFEQGQP